VNRSTWNRFGAPALLSSAALLCGSCVQLSFERDTLLEPLPKGALASLVPGVSDFQTALETLGPPVLAWELPQQGVALAWGWSSSMGWRLNASVSNDSGASVSFDYSREYARMRGAVLFFDREWRLTAMREGLLSDLRDATRAKPSDVDAE
jgi:hypothetical protein